MTIFNRLAALAVLAAPAAASAHALTINTGTTPPQVMLAHSGTFDPVPPSRVRSILAIDRDGASIAVTPTSARTGTNLLFNVAPAAYWVDYAGPPGGRTATGERRLGPKGTHPDAVDVSQSRAWALVVIDAAAPLASLPAGRLSLVPASSLDRIRAGDELVVRAAFDGKPLAGATIRLEAARSETGGAIAVTDTNGEVRVRVPADGMNVFGVSKIEEPSSDPTLDILRMQATLTFTAIQAP